MFSHTVVKWMMWYNLSSLQTQHDQQYKTILKYQIKAIHLINLLSTNHWSVCTHYCCWFLYFICWLCQPSIHLYLHVCVMQWCICFVYTIPNVEWSVCCYKISKFCSHSIQFDLYSVFHNMHCFKAPLEEKIKENIKTKRT